MGSVMVVEMLEGIDMLCDLFDGGGEVDGCVEFISPGAITSLVSAQPRPFSWRGG